MAVVIAKRGIDYTTFLYTVSERADHIMVQMPQLEVELFSLCIYVKL